METCWERGCKVFACFVTSECVGLAGREAAAVTKCQKSLVATVMGTFSSKFRYQKIFGKVQATEYT